MGEKRWSVIARAAVGGLLLAESVVMLLVAFVTVMIGGLASALAFLAGAGNATQEQVNKTFAVIALTLASPFLVVLILAVGGVFLLLRKRRGVIVAAGIFAIATQIAFHRFFDEAFHAWEIAPGALHLTAIAMAIVVVPSRGALVVPGSDASFSE